MNKPIRTMAIFCMLLFLALMLNATYLQYFKADDLNDNAAQPPGHPGVVLPRARRDPRRPRRGGRERAVRRPVQVPARLPAAAQVRPVTGCFSYYSQTGIERTQNDVLSGDDSRLFVTRLVDMVSNASPKGGSVAADHRTPRPRTRRTTGCRRSARDVQGAVVAIEPSTGRILAMVSTPTFDPNQLACHDLGEVAKLRPGSTRTRPSPAQPGDPDHAAAGLDVQAGHRRGGARERQLRRRLAGARRRRRTSCRRPTRRLIDNERPRLRRRPDHR